MKLNDFVIDIIFNILKNKTLTTLTPIKVKFYQGNVDKTMDFFGINSYSIATSNWSAANSKQIQNNTNLTVGTLLENVNGTLTLKFYTDTDVELCSYSYSANIVSGSAYTIIANALKVSLPNLTTNLANFVLNYIFRNVTTGKPSTWYLEFQEPNTTAYQSRILLDLDKFSETYTNEIGWKCVSYGKYTSVTTNTTKQIKYGKLYTGSSGGTSWFDTVEFLPHNVYSGRIIELYNNNLVISVPPTTLATDFLLPSNVNSIFHVDLDGRSEDISGNREASLDTVSYNAVSKLFKSECASMMSTEVLEYPNINFPTYFTINFFVYFISSPTGRQITMVEKPGSFRLYQNNSNQLCVNNGDDVLLIANWTPTINTWYHIYIAKDTNELRLRVNDTINEFVTVSSTLEFNNNSNVLRINNSLSPILGLCNGLYIADNVQSFNLYAQPAPKNPYEWKYINSHVWRTMTNTQWYKYCV